MVWQSSAAEVVGDRSVAHREEMGVRPGSAMECPEAGRVDLESYQGSIEGRPGESWGVDSVPSVPHWHLAWVFEVSDSQKECQDMAAEVTMGSRDNWVGSEAMVTALEWMWGKPLEV